MCSLSYFKHTGAKRQNNKQEAIKRTKQVRKDRATAPLLSSFVDVAAKGVSSSTAENYNTAVRSFTLFCGGGDARLSALNADSVWAYQQWLHDQGVCPNTSSCYMRSLRAIYNKAVAKHLVKDKAPFKGVFTGNERTVKRSIGKKEIRRLSRPLSYRGEAIGIMEMYLDIFLFSFYAMGMPFVDLAHLKRSQVRDGVLTYHRRKTGQQVKVTLEKCMLDILTKYAQRESEYLFPILYKVEGGKGGKTVEVSYSSALNRYNRALKALARQAGIKQRLTSYVARHSWASIAYERNVDLPVISKALGHTDTKTTLIYISEIDDRQLAKANRKLLKEIFIP